ncbi:MAG: hypothetical protein Ta2F_12440 [Termitinemataceae bacterium]|nr:MAG: hypothetical protein Ta2F_12440 [Termitinemataceae bacterium]
MVAAIAAIIILAVSCPSGKSIYLDETETDNEPIPSHIYTVTFNPSGGNWSGSTAPISVKTDGYYRAAVPQEPEKSGFSFAGWHLQDSVDSAEFTSSTVVKSNMIVYAVWTGGASSITFYYNYAGAKTEVFSKKFIVAPETTTILPETPVRKNYAFQGWYTTPQTDIELTDNTPSEDKFILGVSEISNDTSLWALWQRRPANSIVVQFEPYPGAFLGSAFVMADNGWKLPEGTSLPLTGSRPHYNPESADHWFMEDGTEFDLDTVLSAEDGDQIISAKWTGKTYTVHFMVGEGGSEHANASVTYPQNTVTLPATMPVKENCYNDGFWYNGEDRFTNQTIVTGDTNVFPKWITSMLTLTSLSAKYNSINANLDQITNTTYTCSLPSFVESVIVRATCEGPEGTYLTFDPADKTISSWGSGDNKTVTITVHSGLGATTKVYTVTFDKKTEIETQIATGGTTTFVRTGTGTNATWDEVHTFTSGTTTTTNTGGAKLYTGTEALIFDTSRMPGTAKVLVVAGGGAGGNGGGYSGGGGGGGLIYKSDYSITQNSYEVVVGYGGLPASGFGSAGDHLASRGYNGGNSRFGTTTETTRLSAPGGGGGASHTGSTFNHGAAGGSGGGGTYQSNGGGVTAFWYDNASRSPNNVTAFGYRGGTVGPSAPIPGSGAGGGGAGGQGVDVGAANTASAGGAGKTIDISGSAVTYAAGGYAGRNPAVAGAVGTGNGGSGSYNVSGGAGGSGIVIVRFPFSE